MVSRRSQIGRLIGSVGALTILLGGCGPRDLGKESTGTACLSDLDCNADRICVDGQCFFPDEIDRSTNNASTNNASTNNAATNSSTTSPSTNNETVSDGEHTNRRTTWTPPREPSFSTCLEVEREPFEIAASLGAATSRPMTITNCSDEDELHLTEVVICTLTDGACSSTGEVFALGGLPAPLPRITAVLQPGESEVVEVVFDPPALATYSGQLKLHMVGADAPRLVELQGEGVDGACPTAVAEAKLADSTRWVTEINTIPLKTIQFRGTNSIDQDGDVARYEWSLIQKPSNSTARFTPSATVEEPSLFLDLAGEYVVELEVFDDKGLESCGDRALITIRATPDEDIHIQLVWDTPGDADQTDAAGTDLDLHFLHPNGNWNELPFDIFWNNPTNAWGAPGAADDPSLDIDDTDGAGPENINLTDPEAGLTYAVGVYYYTSNGYGPSYATLRIFLQGRQEYEYMGMYLATDKAFWYAATISWPTGSIFDVNQVSSDFPSRP